MPAGHDDPHMRVAPPRATLTPMTPLDALLAVHIAGGATALVSMFVPMVARKGGRLHRRGGWVFVAGMTVVSVTAFGLSAARVLTDPTPGGRAAGLFLFYIAILTAAGVSAGVRVLRAKGRTAAHRHPWDVGVAATLTVASAAIAAYGVLTGTVLFAAFSVIGLLSGIGQLRYWLRPPSDPMHWWFAHMGQMLGACLAATTAFLVVNAGRFGVGRFSLLVWLAPAAIGAPGIAIWTAFYRRKFVHAALRRQAAAGRSPSTSTADETTGSTI
jgi:uncharacterized membrane protein